MKKLKIENIESLVEALKEHSSKTIILLFTGSVDESSGHSWCPDCVLADPAIEKVTSDAKYADEQQYLFITVFVGQRDVWKNPQNEFRSHKDFRLRCVPTLMKWGTRLRLEESQCADEESISMLLDE